MPSKWSPKRCWSESCLANWIILRHRTGIFNMKEFGKEWILLCSCNINAAVCSAGKDGACRVMPPAALGISSLCSTVGESCARCAVVLHRQSALSAHSFHRLISVDSWPHTSNLSPFQRRLLKNCTYPRVYWCHDNLFSRLSQDLWWIKSSWLARLKNEMVVRKRETCILSSIQVQPAALGSLNLLLCGVELNLLPVSPKALSLSRGFHHNVN